ncbi:MAG: hypothetical protein KatS3mg094_174 [Candidatus Parcubacteria bacterium]|nr:MAG: hypothetical protein KatS3mg094_174 [Candidatus Parcubacteria bacterium]
MKIKEITKKVIIIILFLAIISSNFIFKKNLLANLIYFYPQNCLGSFINPEKAQGKPEVDSPDLINESNSAVYLGGFKEIYCGNFQGPEAKGDIKKITLHFNWIITKEKNGDSIIKPTSTESNILEKIIPSKTIEFEFNTSPTPTPETTSTIESTSSPEINFLFNKDQLLRSSALSSVSSASVLRSSAFDLRESALIKFVFAQETTTSLETTPATESNSESTTINTQTETATQTINETQQSLPENQSAELSTTSTSTNNQIENITSSTTTQTLTTASPAENQNETNTTTTILETTTTPILIPPKTLFEIHYTLDGQNWNYLGNINENNWQNISFEIPVNNWLDISKIQIKINSLPETDYYLYLESMWFEIEYEEKNEEDEVFDILGNYKTNIIVSKESFELDEIPYFEFKISKNNNENEIDISEIKSINIKVFNSNKELIFQTNKLDFDYDSKNFSFKLDNFLKLYPNSYRLKIYLNKYLAGEYDFNWGGNIVKEEKIDSDKELIFIDFNNKNQIWNLTKSDINSFEKIWEGKEFPNYKIIDSYLILNFSETILGYDLLSKTSFTYTFEKSTSTIININNKKYSISPNFDFLEINESPENENQVF